MKDFVQIKNPVVLGLDQETYKSTVMLGLDLETHKSTVMLGLDPGIHSQDMVSAVDCLVKPYNDEMKLSGDDEKNPIKNPVVLGLDPGTQFPNKVIFSKKLSKAAILLASLSLSACQLQTLSPSAKLANSVPSVLASPIASPAVNTGTVTNINISAATPSPIPTSSASAMGSNQPEKPIVTPLPSPVPSVLASVAPSPTPTPLPTATPRPPRSGSGSGTNPRPVPITVTKVEIATPASNQITKGHSLTLNAQVVYSNFATSHSLSWSSDHPEIASVDTTGKVTAHQAGDVVIQVTSTENTSKFTTLTVSIVNPVVRIAGRIVYVANNDIYMMSGDNQSPLRLTNDGESVGKLFPRLNWTGTQLVYSTPGRKVFRMATTGSDSPVDLGFDPNGTDPLPFFVYSGEIIYQAVGGAYGSTPLIMIKVGNNPPVPYSAFFPIQFWGGVDFEGFIIIAKDGHILRFYYTNPGNITDMGTGQNPKIPLCAFCDYYVFDDAGEIVRSGYYDTQRYVLTDSPDFNDTQPAMSPGQEKIVFVSDREGNQDLFMMSADGSNIVNLTNTPNIDESMPDWSLSDRP